MIKTFSAWPSSVQNKTKISLVFASYSSKAQNTTCAIWLLGYKHFVHFSIWTKCLSDGVKNANTRTTYIRLLKNGSTSFWRTSRIISTWPSRNLFHNFLFRMKRGSTTSIVSQNNIVCNRTNESVKIVISLHCVNSVFPYRRQPTTLKCTKIFIAQKSYCACGVLNATTI